MGASRFKHVGNSHPWNKMVTASHHRLQTLGSPWRWVNLQGQTVREELQLWQHWNPRLRCFVMYSFPYASRHHWVPEISWDLRLLMIVLKAPVSHYVSQIPTNKRTWGAQSHCSWSLFSKHHRESAPLQHCMHCSAYRTLSSNAYQKVLCCRS